MNIEDWSAVFLSGWALPAGRLSPSAEQILKQFPVWDGCYEKRGNRMSFRNKTQTPSVDFFFFFILWLLRMPACKMKRFRLALLTCLRTKQQEKWWWWTERGNVFLFLFFFIPSRLWLSPQRTAPDGRERLSCLHNNCWQRQLAGEILLGRLMECRLFVVRYLFLLSASSHSVAFTPGATQSSVMVFIFYLIKHNDGTPQSHLSPALCCCLI